MIIMRSTIWIRPRMRLRLRRFGEQEVLAVELDNKPGALGEVAEKLAQAKINIRYAYATPSEGSTKATVLLAVPDVVNKQCFANSFSPSRL